MSDRRWAIERRGINYDEPEYELIGTLGPGLEIEDGLVEEYLWARDVWRSVQIVLHERYERKQKGKEPASEVMRSTKPFEGDARTGSPSADRG